MQSELAKIGCQICCKNCCKKLCRLAYEEPSSRPCLACPVRRRAICLASAYLYIYIFMHIYICTYDMQAKIAQAKTAQAKTTQVKTAHHCRMPWSLGMSQTGEEILSNWASAWTRQRLSSRSSTITVRLCSGVRIRQAGLAEFALWAVVRRRMHGCLSLLRARSLLSARTSRRTLICMPL